MEISGNTLSCSTTQNFYMISKMCLSDKLFSEQPNCIPIKTMLKVSYMYLNRKHIATDHAFRSIQSYSKSTAASPMTM